MPEAPKTATPPPTRRILKRWSIGSCILFTLLFILWLIWSHIANTRLKTKIDEILARHEQMYPADFSPPALPDNQNAATYFRAAVAAKKPNVDSPGASNYNFNNFPPFSTGWHQLADAAVTANPHSLALVRQARLFNEAAWVPTPASPAIQVLLPHLNDARDLANLVADSGLDAHLHGDDAQAIERIRDVLHQSRMLHDFTIITRLVSLGIQSLAIAHLEVIIADDLQIQTENSPLSSTNPARHAVPRRVILELIQELLDEQTQHHWARNGLLGERMMQLDTASWIANHSILLQPLFNLEAGRCLDKSAFDLRAIDQTTWPAAQAILATAPKIPAKMLSMPPATAVNATPPRFSRILSSELAGSLDRYILVEFRDTAERRIAAVMLAARLYRWDHGQLPANLNELVPAYLPLVPADPFLAASTPMGYSVLPKSLPNGGNRPMLYFDPPGYATTLPPPPLPAFGWQQNGSRQWRDLTAWVPTTMPVLPDTLP